VLARFALGTELGTVQTRPPSDFSCNYLFSQG
jgi:hypothetical protein